MGFYFPAVPGGATSQGLQWALTVIFSIVILGCAGWALLGWRRTGSPIGLVLLVGAVAASLNEGFVDAGGLCWYPREGQVVGYDTILAVPLWCVLAYAAYFGGAAYVLYEQARAGITKRTLWIVLAGMWASEIVFEIAVVNLHGYSYFGHQPISIGGWPIYWIALNFPGMFVTVALLLRLPRLFTGWRVLFAVVVPGVTYAFGAFGAAWPVFSALHLPGASDLVLNLASAATMFIGVAMLAVTIPLIAVDGPLGQPSPAEPVVRQRVGTVATPR